MHEAYISASQRFGAITCAFFALIIVVSNSLHFQLKQGRLEPVLAGLPRWNERLFLESDRYGPPRRAGASSGAPAADFDDVGAASGPHV